MRVIVFSKKTITSKGKNYTLLHVIDEDGEASTQFFNDDQKAKFELDSVKVVPSDTLKEMFDNLDTVNVEYGKRGQVIDVSVK